MKLRLITEVAESDLISITTDWMEQNYNRMNQSLFGGKLGGCRFGVFTTGRGSQGGVLGWFSLGDKKLKYNKKTRKIFLRNQLGDVIYVNSDNFEQICKPTIKMNGNYRWTQKAALSTLAHEMCHYYTCMNGWYPLHAHGYDFKSIAAAVSAKSNEFFTVQRIASAEKIDELELDNNIKAKNQKRKENKFNRIIPVFSFYNDGRIGLTNANSVATLRNIIEKLNDNKDKTKVISVKVCTDEELKKLIFEQGYDSSMTTYRYWDITSDTTLLNALKNFDLDTV